MLNDYQLRQQKKHERRKAAVKAIADHLDGWDLVVENGHEVEHLNLVGPEGVKVNVSKDWNDDGRLMFSPDLSNGLRDHEPYQPDRPEAGISVDRDPKAAARDVKRRCLDPTVPYVLDLRQKKAERDAVNDARRDALSTLSEALGGEVIKHYNGGKSPLESKVYRQGRAGKASIEAQLRMGELLDFEAHTYGPDLVNVKLDNLPMDVALDLCEWLRFRLWPENGQQGRLL